MKSLLAATASLLMLAAASTAQAQPFAYVTGQNGAIVSVVDTITNTVVTTVPVGSNPFGVVINPAGTRAYVSNSTPNTMSVINTATNTVVTTFPLGNGPAGVAMNPAGTRVYVANLISNSVSVVNTATNTVIATIPALTQAYGVAVNPAGTRLFVTNGSLNQLSVIDTSTNNLITTVPVGSSPGPFGIAFNPSGTRAYVANEGGNTVSVVDTSTNTVVATVTVGLNPGGVAVNPAGTRAYSADGGSDTVSVINTATDTVIATVSVGTGSSPRSIAFNPSGTRVYVGNPNSNTVTVIDTATDTVVTNIPVSAGPFGIAVAAIPAATAPDAPTIGTATAGVGSATVSYTPPAFDGGTPILSYTATSNPGGITGVATAGPITVTGLIAGTPYTFTVTATNAIGTGLPSAPSNSVTPTGPAVTVTGTTTFPATAVGASSGVQPITITNTGAGTLTLSLITVSNVNIFFDSTGGPAPNAAHWCGFGSVAGGAPNTGVPINIAPGNSCVINSVFAPNAVGGLSSSIIINSDAPTSPTTITLTGSGLPPVATIAPASILFGNAPVSLGINQISTFSNPSAAPYTITSLAAAGLGFSVAPSGANPCSVGAIVAGGGSCTYTATFTATGPGASNGTVTVGFQPFGVGPSYNATQNTNGNGFIPPATNAPASINFGNVPVTLTVTQNFTFTNQSNTTLFPAPYTLASIATTGLGFSAVGSGGTPCAVSLVLAPGTSCTMTVSFQIGGTGSSNGTTTIGYQAGFGANPIFSAAISLVGNGILMPSTLAPTGATFGNVTVGTPVTQAFTFTNDSSLTGFPSTYTITSFTTSGLGFTAVGSGATPCAVSLTLAPGASCGATVTFVILVTGASNGTTTIGFLAGLGTDPPYSKVFGSSGNGVLGPTPAITSATTASGVVSSAFTYQIVATNTPTSFGASGLPPGLGINAATGQITGTPTGAGTFNATITATNLSGTGSQALTITIAATPVPSMTVAFAPASVLTAVNATLTLTLTNPNASPAVMSVGSAVTMPPGLSYSGLIDGCGASSSVIVSTVTTIDLGMGGSIPALGSCTITVQVQSAVAGSFPVTVSPGNLITSFGNNANTSTATLIVTPPVPITTLLLESPVATTGTATASASIGALVGLKLVITTPVGPGFTAGAFTITFPAGIVTDATPAVVNSCGGVITAVAGGNTLSGSGLALGGSNLCSVRVNVVSAATGIYPFAFPVGALSTSTGSNATASSATLTVTVAPSPLVSLTPPSVAFGARTVNTTSPPTVVTLTNIGTANLVIFSITASGDFGFTSTCPISTPPVVPTGLCAINITFTPLTAAVLAGNISIVSNAPGSPHSITLSGTGSAVAVPGISLTPTSVVFGAQAINTTSGVQSIVVTNTGFATLTFSSIVVGAPFARVALLPTTPPDCGASLAPTSSCQIGVTFSPISIGAFTGTVTIADNAAGSPHTAALSGTGTATAVAIINTSGTLAFGDQVINTSNAQNLIINNSGAATLTISSITLTGTNAANFTLTGQSGCTSIAPGGSCTLNVTFATTTTGTKTAQIDISSNAQNGSLVTTSLSGNGILAPRPVVKLTSTVIGFGNVIIGGAAPSQVVTLTNSGGEALNTAGIFVSGDFVLMSNCGSTLASLASCAMSIAFTPLLQGSRFGELVVTSNATTSPDRVQLSGTGCRWFSQTQSRFFLTSC